MVEWKSEELELKSEVGRAKVEVGREKRVTLLGHGTLELEQDIEHASMCRPGSRQRVAPISTPPRDVNRRTFGYPSRYGNTKKY